MAEGWLRRLGGAGFEVESAGSHPTVVNPTAVEVMGEAGVDISRQRSKHLREFLGRRFDFVITVCDRANETCPVFPGSPQRLHWSVPDPAAFRGGEEERREVYRSARDEILERIRRFLGAPSRSGGAKEPA